MLIMPIKRIFEDFNAILNLFNWFTGTTLQARKRAINNYYNYLLENSAKSIVITIVTRFLEDIGTVSHKIHKLFCTFY